MLFLWVWALLAICFPAFPCTEAMAHDPPYAATAASWNISAFLPYEFDPGCRPLYKGGYVKEGFRNVWVDRPTKEEAYKEHERCVLRDVTPTVVKTGIEVKRIVWVDDSKTRYAATVQIQMAWPDHNASGVDVNLLWMPRVRFRSASNVEIKSSYKAVHLDPIWSTNSSGVQKDPLVELQQTFQVEIDEPEWRYRSFPFDTKEFTIIFDLGMSKNAVIEKHPVVSGSPQKGDLFSGLRCKERWALQMVSSGAHSGSDMAAVKLSMQADRAAHIIVGAYMVPVLAALLIGWAAFFFGVDSNNNIIAPMLLAICFLVTCCYLRWAQMLTPSSAWSWLDMMLTVQALTVAVSTVAIAVCYYVKESAQHSNLPNAIVSSFRVFFPLHSMLGAMVLASILNLWSSGFRYLLSFLWVAMLVLFQLACGKYLYQTMENAPTDAQKGTDSHVSDYENWSGDMNKTRKDFPNM